MAVLSTWWCFWRDAPSTLRDPGLAKNKLNGLSHYFGVVISDGSPLEKVFRIRNDTGRTLDIVSAAASVPCCSGLGPLPKTVPPHHFLTVSTWLLTSGYAGPHGASFRILTDFDECPELVLSVRANLVEALKIETIDIKPRLIVGRPARALIRVIHRGQAGSPLAPKSVVAAAPAHALLLHPGSIRNESGAVSAWEGKIAVDLPALKSDGPFETRLVLAWGDGTEETRSLKFDVQPDARIVPAGLTIHRDEGVVERSLTLRSETCPVTIKSVKSSKLVGYMIQGPPNSPERMTSMTLHLDGSLQEGSDPAILIETDHPLNPTLRVPVIVNR